jgi:hypothetical protein
VAAAKDGDERGQGRAGAAKASFLSFFSPSTDAAGSSHTSSFAISRLRGELAAAQQRRANSPRRKKQKDNLVKTTDKKPRKNRSPKSRFRAHIPFERNCLNQKLSAQVREDEDKASSFINGHD